MERKMTVDDVGWFEISSYSYNGKDLIIKEIRVYSNDGDLLKSANLEKIIPFLCKKPVRFRTPTEDNELVKELMRKFKTAPVLK